MREATQPGQVWCWGSSEHRSRAERLWLITDVFSSRDGLAVDLEEGVEKPIFNLPASSYDESSKLLHASEVMWRRVL